MNDVFVVFHLECSGTEGAVELCVYRSPEAEKHWTQSNKAPGDESLKD